MIIIPKKNEEKLKEKAPAYSDDLDMVNEASRNLAPYMGLLATCHKSPVMLALYFHKTKTIELRCPQCNATGVAIHVAKRPIEKEIVCEPSETN